MRGNIALLGKLKNNASKRSFFNAAENLMELAKGSKSIENFTPPVKVYSLSGRKYMKV